MTEYGLERGEQRTQGEVCGTLGHPKVRVTLQTGWADSPYGLLCTERKAFFTCSHKDVRRCGGNSGSCVNHLQLRSA